MANMISRIVTGDGLRKSRLHTYSGRMIDRAGLAYLPSCLWSTLLLKCGYRQQLPWLGYRAVRHLDKLIRPSWRILEYGSGMSSLFFAKRCSQLVSIESDREWFSAMLRRFNESGIQNVNYRLCGPSFYATHSDLSDGTFDLVVVDGIARDQCAVEALRVVRPGGYVFYDNSDVPWAEYAAARRTLVEAAASVTIFDDFTPFQLQVNESLLIRTRF